jgi:cation transport ATPase
MRRLTLIGTLLLVMSALVMWNNVLGISHGAYATIWWWDIVSHILGGIAAGLGYAWFVEYVYASGHPRFIQALIKASMIRRLNLRVNVKSALIVAFVIGVAWEIFEYVFQTGQSAFMSYAADTVKDLINDSIGGALVGHLVKKHGH